MENPTEESGRHCALCLVFLSADKVKLCGGCKRRAYCSKECQTMDWSVGTHGQVHKIWCKLECGDATRSESHPGIQDLMPLNGSTAEKVALNGLADGEAGTAVCLRICRVNHDCQGNAGNCYDEKFKVGVLYAIRDIQKGEEISYNYMSEPFYNLYQNKAPPGSIVQWARNFNSSQYGINCADACFCKNEKMLKLIEKGRNMVSSIDEHCLEGRIPEAWEVVDTLLELVDFIGSPCAFRKRVLFVGFQIGIRQMKTLPKAIDYIKEAYEITSTILGSPKSKSALDYKRYMMIASTRANFLGRGNLCTQNK